MIIHHTNDGSCQKCEQIFDRYPNFYGELRRWFCELQALHPEAHISCAGRGQHDQEQCFVSGASDAAWGHSAHNFNCAIDIWVNEPVDGVPTTKWMYPEKWFLQVLAPNLPVWVTWYGRHGAPFYELPHVELARWREHVLDGIVKLVE